MGGYITSASVRDQMVAESLCRLRRRSAISLERDGGLSEDAGCRREDSNELLMRPSQAEEVPSVHAR